MFFEAPSFDRSLKWSRVKNMNGTFSRASSFNSDISAWDLSRVESTLVMFADAISFNQSLCSWGSSLPATANVSSMSMFRNTSCPSYVRAEAPGTANGSLLSSVRKVNSLLSSRTLHLCVTGTCTMMLENSQSKVAWIRA